MIVTSPQSRRAPAISAALSCFPLHESIKMLSFGTIKTTPAGQHIGSLLEAASTGKCPGTLESPGLRRSGGIVYTAPCTLTHLRVGDRPTRQLSLQSVVVEATWRLKPSV